MFTKFIFNRLSPARQIAYLRKRGIILGTRVKDGRKIYIYMLKDLFVEVIYNDDNTDGGVEKMSVLRGLDNLNSYLEREFRTSF